MRISNWIIKEPITKKCHNDRYNGCVVLLTGRGLNGSLMLRFFKLMNLRRTLAISLVPFHRAWYPVPNGPKDQEMAVRGLSFASYTVSEALKRIHAGWQIPYDQIILGGFSAGAVVTLDILNNYNNLPLGGYFSLGGAIFEPHKVKKAWTKSKVVLQHGLADDCFSWEERYLPMRNALQSNGYNLTRIEHKGVHMLYREDAPAIGRIFAQQLNYSKKYRNHYFNRKRNED